MRGAPRLAHLPTTLEVTRCGQVGGGRFRQRLNLLIGCDTRRRRAGSAAEVPSNEASMSSAFASLRERSEWRTRPQGLWR